MLGFWHNLNMHPASVTHKNPKRRMHPSECANANVLRLIIIMSCSCNLESRTQLISVGSKIYLEVISEVKIQAFTYVISKFGLFQMSQCLIVIKWLHILMSRGPWERGCTKYGIKWAGCKAH